MDLERKLRTQAVFRPAGGGNDLAGVSERDKYL